MDAAEQALRDAYAFSLTESKARDARISENETRIKTYRALQVTEAKKRAELIASATALGIDLTSEPLPF